MQTKQGTAIERKKWTFSAIEHIFDDIRARTGSSCEKYSIFGHSAGSQFVHRMVLFRNDLRIEYAVAANAGSYTLPSFETKFPYNRTIGQRIGFARTVSPRLSARGSRRRSAP